MPLTEEEALSLHYSRLPENFYIPDATLLPGSLRNLSISTKMAVAKRVSRMCIRNEPMWTAFVVPAGTRRSTAC